jgi:colicin import membrane protein
VQFGLVISVLLHLAILGWAVLTIQTQREIRVAEPEPIAVDLLTPSEATKVRQGVRTAKQMEAEAKETPKPEISKKEAPKPTPVATPKPEPPKPDPPKEEVKEPPKPEPPKPEPPKEVAKVEPPKLPEPATDPIAEKLAAERPDPAIEQAKKLEEERQEAARKADELKKAEEQRKAEEEQRKAEEQKRADEQKKREEDEKRRKEAELKKKKEDDERKRKAAELKKKQDEEKRLKEAEAKRQKSFDDQMRDMQALLNKVPDKGAPLPNTPQEEPSKNKGPVLGSKEGRDNRLSASELAVLGQIIRSCVQSKWNVLGGGEQAQHTEVKMRLRFNMDGTLAAEPQVTNQQGTPFFLAMSDSAVRAVKACEPFPLPAPKYEFWRDMILTFKPSDMF